MDTKIGNYSDVIRGYEECGLSTITSQTESDCFEYNRDLGSNLKKARNLEHWEAPWVVDVESRRNWGVFTTYLIKYVHGNNLIELYLSIYNSGMRAIVGVFSLIRNGF